MYPESDIQNGDVIVNWQVTAAIIVLSNVAFATIVLQQPVVGFVVGLLVTACWIVMELRAWDPDPADDLGGDD